MPEPTTFDLALADRWFPAAEAVASVKAAAQAARAMRQAAERHAAEPDPLERARLARLAELLVTAHPGARSEWRDPTPPDRAALDAVAQAVNAQAQLPTEPARAELSAGQRAIATCPVRVDLAGGWSDTPPICNELGGTVVNAAITLDGRQPLQAIAQLTEEPVVRITSVDLDRSVAIDTTAELLDHADPHDWAALPKAALVLAGLAPGDASVPLPDWLDRVGGGVRLTVSAALPKGSGLGTSSILGATVLASLATLTGRAVSREALTAQTSMLEQLMRTGGGWQDQLGGIVPGFKTLRTSPGLDQHPAVEQIDIPAPARAELDSRLVLYYTGLQRLAANILQNVVSRYLAREPESLRIVEALKQGAERMHAELCAGDIDAFADSLLEYWALKRRFDPGATTPEIEALFDTVRDQLAGYELPGAGGGGYMFMIAKDADAARRVRETLAAHQPNATARLYEAGFDPVGLRITVA